jgi:hypothetical protein
LRLQRFANRFLAFVTISNRLPPDALLSTWTPLSACATLLARSQDFEAQAFRYRDKAGDSYG